MAKKGVKIDDSNLSIHQPNDVINESLVIDFIDDSNKNHNQTNAEVNNRIDYNQDNGTNRDVSDNDYNDDLWDRTKHGDNYNPLIAAEQQRREEKRKQMLEDNPDNYTIIKRKDKITGEDVEIKIPRKLPKSSYNNSDVVASSGQGKGVTGMTIEEWRASRVWAYKQPKAFNSVDEVNNLITPYMNYCFKNDITPVPTDLPMILGVSNKTVSNYRKLSGFKEYFELLYDVMLGGLVRDTIEGRGSTNGQRILLANVYGWTSGDTNVNFINNTNTNIESLTIEDIDKQLIILEHNVSD